MDLADYLGILRRRWWLVVIGMFACIVGAGVTTALQTPMYTASVQLLVPAAAGTTAARTDAVSQAGSYAAFAMTGPVVTAARVTSGAPAAEQVSVKALADGATPFVTISVESSSAQTAFDVARAYPAALPMAIKNLEQATTAAPTFSTVEPPTLPTSPSSPNRVRNVAVGTLLGLVLGLCGAVVREALDRRVRTASQLHELTGVPLLGLVPNELRTVKLPAMEKPSSRRAEAYKAVRANLEFVATDGLPGVVMVTSAGPGEGKSSLSANLALTAARAGRQVALIDADLRRPTLHTYFGMSKDVGLSDVLTERLSLAKCIQGVQGERLAVLCSGPLPAAPSELVGSSRMVGMLELLTQHFDLVVVDTPPVLPVADALLLGVHVGGVVLVARMQHTPQSALVASVEALGQVDAKILGVVGNLATTQAGYGYGYGYRKYGYGPDTKGTDLSAELAREVADLRAAERHEQEGGRPLTRRQRLTLEEREAELRLVMPSDETAPIAKPSISTETLGKFFTRTDR